MVNVLSLVRAPGACNPLFVFDINGVDVGEAI